MTQGGSVRSLLRVMEQFDGMVETRPIQESVSVPGTGAEGRTQMVVGSTVLRVV